MPGVPAATALDLSESRLDLPRRPDPLAMRPDSTVSADVQALVVEGDFMADLDQRQVCRSAAMTPERLRPAVHYAPAGKRGASSRILQAHAHSR
jgi:hypothetical protein